MKNKPKSPFHELLDKAIKPFPEALGRRGRKTHVGYSGKKTRPDRPGASA